MESCGPAWLTHGIRQPRQLTLFYREPHRGSPSGGLLQLIADYESKLGAFAYTCTRAPVPVSAVQFTRTNG